MPRRNFLVILAVVLVSLFCYQAADRNPLGRSFSDVADLIDGVRSKVLIEPSSGPAL